MVQQVSGYRRRMKILSCCFKEELVGSDNDHTSGDDEWRKAKDICSWKQTTKQHANLEKILV